MKYDTRQCDRCGVKVSRGRIANGTLHSTSVCHCGGTLATVSATEDDVDHAATTATNAERERCLEIVRHLLVFDSQRDVSWREVQICLRKIREGA